MHSNKARKSEVLQQLRIITESVRFAGPPLFEQEGARLDALRKQLNEYVHALHAPGPFEISLFDAISAWQGLPHALAAASISLSSIQPSVLLASFSDKAAQVQAAAVACGTISGHPLSPVQAYEWTRNLQQQTEKDIQKIQEQIAELHASQNSLLASLGLETFQPKIYEQWKAIGEWISVWLKVPAFPVSLWQANDALNTWQRVSELSETGLQRDAARQQIRNLYNDAALTLPAKDMLALWEQASQQWFLPRWLTHRKIKSQLNACCQHEKTEHAQITEHLKEIIHFQHLQQQIEKEAHWLSPLIGIAWKSGEPHWGEMMAATQVLQRTWRHAGTLMQDPQAFRIWRDRMGVMLDDGVSSYIEMHRSRWESASGLLQLLDKNIQTLWNSLQWKVIANKTHESWIDVTIRQMQQVLDNLDGLRDWCLYRKESHALQELGLHEAIEQLENGALAPADFNLSVQKGIFQAVADFQMDNLPALQQFSSALYTDSIQRFDALLTQFQSLSQQQIKATVGSLIPNLVQEAAKGSEVAILKKAIGNNGRGISIRQLFEQISNLLPRLAPCMLMSPISVAQYLSLSLEPFDLVIFDEASQMPTSEAIGTLARGKSVVVVGDPKQMPPTSFFTSQQFDEDNAEKEDMESILDDCLALPMPGRHLLWHYRSRHESLIAFSNAKYYENKLLTFPSADDIATKVSLVPVEGFYDRSEARHNRAEAEAVVGEVLHRLRNQATRKRSMGIVTFSSVQQQLIQNLMDEAFTKYPELEAMALEAEEPMFIKNLENVQGDERDVILFSIGYGPDKEGKVYMNFGPINREGGWRRLNVAVSRARYEMKVFSTLKASHIDLSRTSSEGVAGLRAFLEYAEKGRIALPISSTVKREEPGELEKELADCLRSLGYDVHLSLGTSGFKIDIAVVHPERPGTYALAVLIDGQRMVKIGSARDRFIGKIQVLRQLGWSVHRVWSAAWWIDRKKVIREIEAAIKMSLSTNIEPVVQKSFLPDAGVLQKDVTGIKPLPLEMQVQSPVNKTIYTMGSLPAVTTFSISEFLEPRHAALIGGQIKKVIEKESPITRKLLFQRVLLAWNISRLGTRIEAHLDGICRGLPISLVAIGKQEIMVPTGFNWKDFTQYRVPDENVPETRRSADEIPIPEIANAMREILQHQISLSEDDLNRETTRKLGFARSGPVVEAAMKNGFNYAIENKLMEERNGRWIAK